MHSLLNELDRRWQKMFTALAAGEDLPPTRRLRAEGLMEAAVLLDLCSEEQITALMDACYRKVNGRSLASEFGDPWREFYPFPQIPGMMRRAPVYPSTKE